jgi:excalibur calcium-binding domain-containing protein
MKKLVPIAVVALLVWAGTTYYERTVRTGAAENPAAVLPLAGSNQDVVPIEEEEQGQEFACDGREYCSQMTSCEEAEYFLENCPNVKMDGGGDGVPCEKQWCKG